MSVSTELTALATAIMGRRDLAPSWSRCTTIAPLFKAADNADAIAADHVARLPAYQAAFDLWIVRNALRDAEARARFNGSPKLADRLEMAAHRAHQECKAAQRRLGAALDLPPGADIARRLHDGRATLLDIFAMDNLAARKAKTAPPG